MPLYVTVSRGPRADLASPVVASSDRAVVGAVLDAIQRLDGPDQHDEADGAVGEPTALRAVKERETDGFPA